MIETLFIALFLVLALGATFYWLWKEAKRENRILKRNEKDASDLFSLFK